MASAGKSSGGISYTSATQAYFDQRGLRRYAGVWSLWALGVGAVISGHFSGWNFGLATGGFGGLLVAAILIACMYLGLVFCIAEMAAALPHTGGAYSFSRTAWGPWGGFVTGLAENLEFILTPAVIVFFIGAYLGGIFGTEAAFQPVWWIGSYLIFLALNISGVELSFKLSLVVTLIALAILLFFGISAIAHMDFSRWALNIGVDASGAAVELPEGGGPFLPFGWQGVFASLPFAVWLFLAIEQLPLAAEESIDPRRDLPRGIIAGMFTLIFFAFMIQFTNTSVANGAFAYRTSSEPLLDGFRAIYGDEAAKLLALAAIVGLVASFHTIIFAFGRQIYSLSRAGYFPTGLSVTHPRLKTPWVALITGSVIGLGVLLLLWFTLGTDNAGGFIGGTLLNMAVFGAMISYFMQAVSFIRLRSHFPHIKRPYVSPLGVFGALVTMIVAAITLYYQLNDPVYAKGVYFAAGWYVLGLLYFALIGRHKLILSPEEEFAMSGGKHELTTR